MPEGPSLIIAREDLESFIGKTIQSASGIAPIDIDRLSGANLRDIRTWGKELLLCFDEFTVRIHFLMFGTYFINSKKPIQARLALNFGVKGTVNFYTCDVRMIEVPVDDVYDWSADVMSEKWDSAAARKKIRTHADDIIADVLMDQTIFSGLGNIIKNEVLFRARIHPESRTGNIPPARLNRLIDATRDYVFEFLLYKKAGVLASYWEAYTKKTCVRDGTTLTKKYLGRQKRRCFYCEVCQVRY